VFRRLRDELPAALVQLDRDLADLVEGFLDASGIEYRRSEEGQRVIFEVVSEGRKRFAVGDARGLEDAEALNLVHPLVQAAIAEARRWPGGSVVLRLPPDAPPDLAALAGKTGVLGVVLVDYGGFEPVQRLIAAAVVDGAPIEPSLAACISRLSATDGPPFDVLVDPPWLEDALDEAVFLDQQDVEKGEQEHFERALGQLERYVEDKGLLCRRELAGIIEKLRAARARRDQVVGASDRERIEAEIERLAVRQEDQERRINALDSREDEVYQRWRNHYHKLRYQAPEATRLFRARFRIDPPEPRTSC
jgi:hypothetical protein